MNWVVSDPFESMNTQISGYILDGAKYFTKYKNGTDVNYGLLQDINDENLAGCRFVSLGKLAGINYLFKGATVMLLLENSLSSDGTGIAIGILNGNIVMDCAVDREDAATKLEDFASLCERSSRTFLLWGDFPGVSREYDEDFALTGLIADKKGIKKSFISPLRNNRIVLLVATGVATVCLITAIDLTWDWYTQMKKMWWKAFVLHSYHRMPNI